MKENLKKTSGARNFSIKDTTGLIRQDFVLEYKQKISFFT